MGPRPEFAEAVEQSLHESAAVAAKSIAAYRVGLDLPPNPPNGRPGCRAGRLRPTASGRYRIADPVINAWLAWTAIKIRMPLQIHVGYGDADIDLLQADPLRLPRSCEQPSRSGVPVLLLHNYPFHRNAAYLAQVFSHVFVDVGLAVHNTGRPQPDADPGDPGAGPVRQAAVFFRRVRTQPSSTPRRQPVPTDCRQFLSQLINAE